MLDFVELSALRHQRVADLSFAQQKIVGFARFILRIQHEACIPILWVERDMQMVADLADRLCVRDHVRHLVDGTPDEVLSYADVVRAYRGGGAAPAGDGVGERCAAPIDRGGLRVECKAVSGMATGQGTE